MSAHPHRTTFCGLVACLAMVCFSATAFSQPQASKVRAPRIVNIVNFIRLLEPRSEQITEQVLFDTVVKQVELMKQHQLPGTFLLQYDALMDSRYQGLLKALPAEQFEIGAWWELPQPLVEKAGLPWRGRYPWDWHADVGFASGYTPDERENLVDVYMADFKQVFGYYPKSVASWFIDAHTLQYMQQKYGIVASANCKDQVGTDGYTLWGGYWNQAYYPSKVNAYMPAQTEQAQIPVPVFRMLGSDPLRQYDTGIGGGPQGVISLEPVYPQSGGSPEWVEWFLHNLSEGECLAFNYTQAGQENSFTWAGMGRGLEFQFPLIARLRDQGALRVETLADSGRWFRRQFKTTPPTAMTFQQPLGDDHRQTVWYNSRFYRANLIWEQNHLRIRDIHRFDQAVESPILNQRTTTPAVEFHTLPLVDGFLWSSQQQLAGLTVHAEVDHQPCQLTGTSPRVRQTASGQLLVEWPLKTVEGTLRIVLDEETMSFEMVGSSPVEWWLEFHAADGVTLPFTAIKSDRLECEYRGTRYGTTAIKGTFEAHPAGFRVLPTEQSITLQLGTRTAP